MSFFDSSESNKRLRSIGKVFKDIQIYSKSQGKQACDALKVTEVLLSIKKSQFVSNNRSVFGPKKSGPATKHQSLKEEDETILWKSEEVSEKAYHRRHPYNHEGYGLGRNNKLPKSDGNPSFSQQFGFGLPNKKGKLGAGIRIPFLKH